MKPVAQRYDYDCMRACLASIFECDYEEAPELTLAFKKPVKHWLSLYNKWLYDRGFEVQFLECQNLPKESPWNFNTYWIAGVKSPRRDSSHAVVMLGDQIVWDPCVDDHPGEHRGFLDADVFIPL